jgi:hypothetical protein
MTTGMITMYKTFLVLFIATQNNSIKVKRSLNMFNCKKTIVWLFSYANDD